MHKLKAEGWTVTRSAGSHSVFDLVAIKDPHSFNDGPEMMGEIKLIQCKAGKSAKREIAKLGSLKDKYTGCYYIDVETL